MRTPPLEVRQQRRRQRYIIRDAICANYLAALWESRGDKVRASILRAIRDRKLAEIGQIPPPKDTII
jgi:hypothetical protein